MYVVGAANSAGQAALNLARYAKRVVMLVRGDAVEATMSLYLVGTDQRDPEHRGAVAHEVVAALGEDHLEGITLRDRDSGEVEQVPTSWLFVFIGASPRTDWLGPAVARDDKGFVITGRTSRRPRGPRRGRWPASRSRWRPACPACSRRATYGSTR